MISVKNISKIYGKKENLFQALTDISLDIQDGESVAIIGKSGSGKSTLMHVLSSLDHPDSGEIFINNINISKIGKRKINQFRNKSIGFVFQTFYIQPSETCLENVMIPLEIAGTPLRERKDKALNVLNMVGLSDKVKSKAKNLSGGQKQRLCIARAIINNPDIIFADEPTGNLDTENGKRVMEILFDLNKRDGKTLIIVTHDEDIAALCKRKIYITDGKISDIE